MTDLTITAITCNHNMFTIKDGKYYKVILKNAKKVNTNFLNKDDVQVDIETTEDAVEYKNNKCIIRLKDDDVSEYWSYEEW